MLAFSYRAWLAVAISLLPNLVLAGDLVWNGFFSTGIAATNAKYPYQGTITGKVHPEERTLLGLNLNKSIDSQWRLVGQFVAHSGESDSALKAEWALVAFVPSNSFEVRAGRQRLPLWMVSAYYGVGHAYPWVEPPEELYSLFNLQSFDGISTTFHYTTGQAAIHILPFFGEVRVEVSPNAPTQQSKLTGSDMRGISVEAEVDDIMLRSAIVRASWDLNLAPQIQLGVRDVQLVTFGGKAAFGNTFVMAETANMQDFDQAKYDKMAEDLDAPIASAASAGDQNTVKALTLQQLLYRVRVGDKRATYATLGYNREPYTVFVTAAERKANYIQQYTQDQKSVALGASYAVNLYSDIKIELKHVYLPKDSVGLFSIPIIPINEVGRLRQANVFYMSYDLEF